MKSDDNVADQDQADLLGFVARAAGWHASYKEDGVTVSFALDALVNVVTLEVPSLRSHPEDIPPLLERYLEEFRQSLGRPVEGYTDEDSTALIQYRIVARWSPPRSSLLSLLEYEAEQCCFRDARSDLFISRWGPPSYVFSKTRWGPPSYWESMWNFFDPDAEYSQSVRNLPHREQVGVLTFVTFRLRDSMPREVLERWDREMGELLVSLNLEGRKLDEILADKMIAYPIRQKIKKYRLSRFHYHLDSCFGSCLLRNPENASEVTKSLLHFDGVRYDLERFVVMPNHVHVLIQMRCGFGLRKQFVPRNPALYRKADQ